MRNCPKEEILYKNHSNNFLWKIGNQQSVESLLGSGSVNKVNFKHEGKSTMFVFTFRYRLGTGLCQLPGPLAGFLPFENPITAYFPDTRQVGSSLSSFSATPFSKPTHTSALSVRKTSRLICPARGPIASLKAVVGGQRASL